MERYRRQAAVGAGGARVDALLAALRVLVVGAGGTGAPLLQLLARAGVGELRVIDPDTVSPTDLARQVLYHDVDAREGRPKVEAALEELRRIGGRTRVSGDALALHPRNAEALVEPFDLVFDAVPRERLEAHEVPVELGVEGGEVVDGAGPVEQLREEW